jgi:hypothetical protein
MNGQQIDRQNLEMAIQTVLYRYQEQIKHFGMIDNVEMVKEMAKEITDRAISFQAISSKMISEMERMNYGL